MTSKSALTNSFPRLGHLSAHLSSSLRLSSSSILEGQGTILKDPYLSFFLKELPVLNETFQVAARLFFLDPMDFELCILTSSIFLREAGFPS